MRVQRRNHAIAAFIRAFRVMRKYGDGFHLKNAL
jgi:hypothetical protein